MSSATGPPPGPGATGATQVTGAAGRAPAVADPEAGRPDALSPTSSPAVAGSGPRGGDATSAAPDEESMNGRRARAARNLHPAAWWLWAGGMAGAAMRTTNVVLLALILGVVAFVVASRRPAAPWSRSFATFLRLGVYLVAIRVVIEMLFGARLPGTVLFSLPSADLPSWFAGASLGGPVTVEALARSLAEGFRLAVLLCCFGALNSLCSPYRTLRALPSVLYEAGVAVTMAIAFAPETVAALGRLRAARQLRGRTSRGPAALRGMAVPVLEGALDRSVLLAASMDARGYGRRGELSPGRQRLASAALLAGLLGAAVGTYGVLDASAPRYLALPCIAAGVASLAVALVWKGARSSRTRYRPDRWAGPEWVVSASGLAALVLTLVAGAVDPAGLSPGFLPLVWPSVPLVAVVGVLVGGLPAFVAPEPPGPGSRRSLTRHDARARPTARPASVGGLR